VKKEEGRRRKAEDEKIDNAEKEEGDGRRTRGAEHQPQAIKKTDDNNSNTTITTITTRTTPTTNTEEFLSSFSR